MNTRNWTDLSRKLIDRSDMISFLTNAQAAIGKEALLSYIRGGANNGIVPSSAYPSPFQTTLSGANMTATVSAGNCWDGNGQRIEVTSTQNFTLVSDGTNPTKALLVARYATAGANSIPQPSNPSNTVFKDLTDSFSVVLLLGTPAGSPTYPATAATDVILMGFSIPAGSTLASSSTEDATVRQQGLNSSSAIKTSAYSITPFDRFVLGNATGGAFTFTLPKGKFSEGSEVTIIKTDNSANAVTYQVQGSDTLGWGASSDTLVAQGDSVTLKMRNLIWYQI